MSFRAGSDMEAREADEMGYLLFPFWLAAYVF